MNLNIRNGSIVDTEKNQIIKGDIAIHNGIISRVSGRVLETAEIELNAEGCLVTAGIIDYHLHLFEGASDHGIIPDSALLPNCVTTAVDAGTCGVSTYTAFRKLVLNNTQVRVKSFLNISPIGMLNDLQHENLDPRFYDEERLSRCFEMYSNDLLGLKLRLSLDVDPNMSEDVLYQTMEVAERLGQRLVVHVTNPAMDIEKIALALRPGDIFCHMYQGRGQSIINEQGRVKADIIKARKNGVLFDACNGRSNFDSDVARLSIQESKFYPDIISSDLTSSTLYKEPLISMPYTLSKYLAMGMSIIEIFKSCTSTPAYLIGMEDRIGKIKEGYIADIGIFKMKEKEVNYTDYFGKRLDGSEILVPQATIKDGKILYRQSDFI